MYLDAHAHCEQVLAEIGQELRLKYANGQSEHGGQLWRKTGLLAHAIEEAHDLEVYLVTLRQQIPDVARRIANRLSIKEQAAPSWQWVARELEAWLLERGEG